MEVCQLQPMGRKSRRLKLRSVVELILFAGTSDIQSLVVVEGFVKQMVNGVASQLFVKLIAETQECQLEDAELGTTLGMQNK